MKVVIFCGGFGVRMGEETQRIPKPMIPVGNRPILWHIMKWYASWGYDDFVLCLGYKSESIKEYFLNYNEAFSNDFVLSNGGRDVELLATRHLRGGGSPSSTRARRRRSPSGCSPSRRTSTTRSTSSPPTVTGSPTRRFRTWSTSSGRPARRASSSPSADVQRPRVNADARRRRSLDRGHAAGGRLDQRRLLRLPPQRTRRHQPGRGARRGAVRRLIEKGELIAYRYEGFWGPMDTMKDKQRLDALVESGEGSLA